MDDKLKAKIEKFVDGLDEVLPLMRPIERALAEAVREYYQRHLKGQNK